MLKITGLDVNYGAYRALSNINLEINEGELVVLLGANGAGKSTLFRTISGLQKAASGTIHFRGKALHSLPAHRIVSLGVSQCLEGRKLFRGCLFTRICCSALIPGDGTKRECANLW